MRDVTLNVKDLSKIYGTSTPLTVELLDNTTPLTNKTIIFTINGVSYNRITDNKGKASLNINLIPGTYPCMVHFVGEDGYNPATKACVVRVINNNIPQKETKSPDNYFEVNKIKLYIVMSNGFSVKTGQNIKETKLLHDQGNLNAPTFYFNSGFSGDEFDVTAYIRESDFYNGEQVMSLLNSWNKTNIPVTVVTDSMIVANGKYTMQIKDKKQTRKGYSLWKLRFKQFYENSLSFEAMYDRKVSTLSSVDQLLLKQVGGVNSKSPSDVIRALQNKLRSAGYWDYSSKYDGYWDGIPSAAYWFQYEVMHVYDRATGFDGVDYETICALIDYTAGGINE